MKIVLLGVAAALLVNLPVPHPPDRVEFWLSGELVAVRPSTLETTSSVVLSAGVPDLGRVTGLTRHGDSASWEYPDRDCRVTAGPVDGRLRVSVHCGRGSLRWPVSGADPGSTRLALPRGEGLSVPVTDTWWADRLGTVDVVGGLTLPFWGNTIGHRGVSYLVREDIGTTLAVSAVDGRLRATAEHTFGKDTPVYSVDLGITDGSPVAAAKDYRAALGKRTTLREKIARYPRTEGLLGALHAYTWGDGRDPATVARLRELGLDRLWLGYDADGSPMSKEAVAAAQAAGYLVGPYDSWDNAQDPETADNPGSKWPGTLWPEGCVRRADGSVQPGFGGRGCYLSTAALSREVYAQRVDEWTRNGADSYFLDVDAAGELFTDHSPSHPMTAEQDRQNRLRRMGYLADRGLVLGSESANGWAADVLAFNHGSATPVTDGLWAAERDPGTWGGYHPPARPGFFFKPVQLPADLGRFLFDPSVRVPLYQTVLHDALVSTDRWELPLSKVPERARDRVLLALVNLSPPNLVLDRQQLRQDGERIAELHRFFSPLHRLAGAEPMTGFRWVDDDPRVQESEFGGGLLTVRADFTRGCVEATPRGERSRSWCPANW
ncbi:hypothetical protein JOF53_001346 [Crossiella equi]|uniref:Glycosyl hydrolases related to GH101 family, GHL1-GHL3 n=1 Tax=Crossiella equi TaxID=130796 RepID=A0ABS5A795_9PSEU|nr:glycoside hydrolase [Crossiella equi]MBP2472474.1 hypothetical protein [Crossiella equi]